MFDAGFTYILCKSLMNTRTKRGCKKTRYFFRLYVKQSRQNLDLPWFCQDVFCFERRFFTAPFTFSLLTILSSPEKQICSIFIFFYILTHYDTFSFATVKCCSGSFYKTIGLL